jgi:TRAP-type C4-dicarboxylate transport system permease small subunit
MIQKVLNRYCQWLSHLMVACLLVMVVLVFANVVLRYVFNTGISVSEELSRWLFVWMTFLGAIVALNERAHLGTDTLVARLPRRGKVVCLGLSQLAMLYCCYLLLQGSWQQTQINMSSTSAVMETSMGWFYACGVVFAISAGAVLLMQLLRLLSGKMADHELVGITESEDVPHASSDAA